MRLAFNYFVAEPQDFFSPPSEQQDFSATAATLAGFAGLDSLHALASLPPSEQQDFIATFLGASHFEHALPSAFAALQHPFISCFSL